MGWMTQPARVERSASGAPLLNHWANSPTAVHLRFRVHDTPRRKLFVEGPVGLGLRWTVQRSPFECSTRVVPSMWCPTAVHALGDAHDTPSSVANARLAVGSIAQLLPFQRSASAVMSKLLSR